MFYTENVCVICGAKKDSDDSDLCPHCQAKYGIDDEDEDMRTTRIKINRTKFLKRCGA